MYIYNDTSYGEAHADRYLAFLEAQIAALAKHPHLGKTVEEFPGIRVHLSRIRPSRGSHGHRVFYREVEDGIQVIRVLHSAKDWPDHLS